MIIRICFYLCLLRETAWLWGVLSCLSSAPSDC